MWNIVNIALKKKKKKREIEKKTDSANSGR